MQEKHIIMVSISRASLTELIICKSPELTWLVTTNQLDIYTREYHSKVGHKV